MAILNNLKQAMNEVFTVKKSDIPETGISFTEDELQEINNRETTGMAKTSGYKTEYPDDGITFADGTPVSIAPAAEIPPEPVKINHTATRFPPAVENSEYTVIGKDTIIDGNIRAACSVCVTGTVSGNVESQKDLYLSGKIEGDVSANDMIFENAAVTGNVLCRGNLSVNRNSMIVGDVSSKEVSIDGRIKGKLTVSGKAAFRSNSVIYGEISAGSIEMEDGTRIMGNVTIASNIDGDSSFFANAFSKLPDSGENR